MPLRSRLALTLFLVFYVAAAQADWQSQALRLSGENDKVRGRALQALLLERTLQKELMQAVRSKPAASELRNRALALDVIHAAKLTSLAPELWQAALGFDPAGQALLTALALSSEPLAPWIPERLWGMVADSSRPLTNRLVALESLSRISHWVWIPRHAAFLAQTPHVLRWAGLTALRIQILKKGRARDVDLLAPFLGTRDPDLVTRAQQILVERTGATPHYPAHENSSRIFSPEIFSVFFGYKDSRPSRYVADRIEALYWVEKKLAEGWRTTNDQPTLNPIVLEHPNTPTKIAVWFSSIGPDDGINRKDPYQEAWSARVKSAFEQTLRQSAALAYVGHSRDGGGPDFAPPLLDLSGHANYAAYPRAQSLQNIGAQIRFIGLYSCASRQHFAGLLTSKIPKARLDLSGDLIYWTDALEALDRGLASATRAR